MLRYCYHNWSRVGRVHAGSALSTTGRDTLIRSTCFRVQKGIIMSETPDGTSVIRRQPKVCVGT